MDVFATKQCNHCEADKTVDQFPSYNGVVYYICHECKAKKAREDKQRLRQTVGSIEEVKQFRLEIREKIRKGEI